jgi:colanic acid biosynthesis protein WcaH
MKLDKDIFRCVVEYTPLISIDFLVKRDNKYLLGKRINKPAKNYYFTIGGRIFKNETIQQAIERILKEELNLTLNTSHLALKFIGIFEHFYEDSIFGDDISTHYINLAYLLDFDIIPNNKYTNTQITNIPFNQHSEYIWLSKEEILKREDVYRYVKEVLSVMC